jgi:hypothetical protein
LSRLAGPWPSRSRCLTLILAPFWVTLGKLLKSCGHLGIILGLLWAISELTLGRRRPDMGLSWGVSACLRTSWVIPGLLGLVWGRSGCIWSLLVLGCLGFDLGCYRPVWGTSGFVSGLFWAVLGYLEPVLGLSLVTLGCLGWF